MHFSDSVKAPRRRVAIRPKSRLHIPRAACDETVGSAPVSQLLLGPTVMERWPLNLDRCIAKSVRGTQPQPDVENDVGRGKGELLTLRPESEESEFPGKIVWLKLFTHSS